jgi:PAS domain S-box-containing protein
MIQFQDITNSKVAEQALRESEERWRSYTQESPDHITIIDSNFVIEFSNRPVEGLTLEKLIGQSILDFLPDEQIEDVRSILTEIMQSGKSSTYYTTYNPPNGSNIYFETRAIPRIIDNKIVGALLSSRDITDRKRDEERIQYQADLLQNISDAVISTDMEFKIVTWNNAAVNMYGWNTQEAIGQNIIQLLPNDYLDFTQQEADYEFNKTGIWDGHIIQTKKDGSKLNVLSSMSYLLDDTGKRVGIVYVNRDVTDLIESQRSMLSERDRAMLYLDIMGHDIRNKLQGITIGLDIIQTNIKDNDMYSIFSDVQTAAEQCSRIISTIKRTEHLNEANLESTDLGQRVLENVQEHFGDGIDPTITVTNSANGTQILADQFLDHMISSLLENAVIHNNREDKQVWVNIQTNGDDVVLSIADNGPGISDDRKKELFDKTRRYGGVGLHQVKQIVDKYGGKIIVQDRVDGVASDGVKFEVWFPSYCSIGNEQDKGGK